MYSESITVQNKTGLHARPAATFVQAASRFQSKISIEKDGKEANAKSMLSLLSLGVSMGSTVKITAEGDDDAQAVRALTELIESKFGEE